MRGIALTRVTSVMIFQNRSAPRESSSLPNYLPVCFESTRDQSWRLFPPTRSAHDSWPSLPRREPVQCSRRQRSELVPPACRRVRVALYSVLSKSTCDELNEPPDVCQCDFLCRSRRNIEFASTRLMPAQTSRRFPLGNCKLRRCVTVPNA